MTMRENPHTGIPIDLSQYASVEDALSEAQGLADQLKRVAIRAMTEDNPERTLSLAHIFLWSALARAKGLHDGIEREIQASNPHATFPLIRTYVELDGLLLYVTEKPDYLQKLVANPRDSLAARGRVSFQAVWALAARRYPGIKKVYEELSEFGHFGSSGVWASVRFDDRNPDPGTLGKVTQWIGPGWRDADRDPKLAAAWLVEADDMALREATRFTESRLLPLNRAEGDRPRPAQG